MKEYIIQKSSDGVHFENIGKKFAIRNLNNPPYNFTDPEDVNNTVYYRFQLVNAINAEIKYSRIISIYNKNTPFKISTVNPFNSSIKMSVFLLFQGNVDFILCDMYGHSIIKKTITLYKGNSNVSIDDVSSLQEGLYILRGFFNGSVVQYKLIKTN